jgi:hypothetical protein
MGRNRWRSKCQKYATRKSGKWQTYDPMQINRLGHRIAINAKPDFGQNWQIISGA